MNKTLVSLVATAMICGLSASAALAGGGAALLQPDKTTGPALNVTVVMDATAPAGGFDPPGTQRQFAVRVNKSSYSQAAVFEGALTYRYGCQQPGFATLQASTEERFIGFMNAWIPADALGAMIGPIGVPNNAAIIDIADVQCTAVGGKNYLSFTGVVQFAK